MEIFGFHITRSKAATSQLNSVESRGGWWPIVRESYAGAWQENVEITLANVLTHPTVFACVTLISSDIAKMRLRLVELDKDGIWNEADNPAYSPVLRKPNRYQNRIKFVQCWQISRLIHGNTYVLKQRDQRNVVTALYVLDPQRVRPLVAEDGAVYYELKRDHLSNLKQEQVVVPASEIIHDVMYPLYHPLVGVGPIHASGLAAVLGLKIVNNSATFFANGSNPGGVLTAPGAISDVTAQRLKAYWDANYTGANVGKVAVLGDGLKYEPMSVTADKSQLTEQWKATAEAVCSAYHVPGYMVGIGPAPPYTDIQSINLQYYTQALQEPIESMELLLDEGLSIGPGFQNKFGTEFDLDDLLRMNSAQMMDTITKGIGAGVMKPNEGRAKINLPPVIGGDTPYLQQQNYSLEALNKRDTQADPFKVAAPPESSRDDDDDGDGENDEIEKSIHALTDRTAAIDAANEQRSARLEQQVASVYESVSAEIARVMASQRQEQPAIEPVQDRTDEFCRALLAKGLAAGLFTTPARQTQIITKRHMYGLIDGVMRPVATVEERAEV